MTGLIIIGFLLFLLLLALQDTPAAPMVPPMVVVTAPTPGSNRVGFDTILLIVFLILVALVAVVLR